MPEDPSQPLTSVVSIRGCRKRDRQKTRVARGGGALFSVLGNRPPRYEQHQDGSEDKGDHVHPPAAPFDHPSRRKHSCLSHRRQAARTTFEPRSTRLFCGAARPAVLRLHQKIRHGRSTSRLRAYGIKRPGGAGPQTCRVGTPTDTGRPPPNGRSPSFWPLAHTSNLSLGGVFLALGLR